MKGVALFLMLVGHTAIRQDGLLYELIYSFHMPLFFILAGYFAKSYEESRLSFLQALVKDAKRLLIPYLVASLVIILFTALRAYMKHDISIVIDRAQRLGYVTYDSIPCWFLVALFWIRTLFRPMMRLGRWALPLSVLISGSALLFAHHVTQLPFCILTALAAMVFYAVGWYHKKYGFSKWAIIVSVLCWPYAILWSNIDLYFMRYGIYPLTVLGACGGTYVVYKFISYAYTHICSTYITKKQGVFEWIGVNSLIILCFHSIDIYCCYVTMILEGIFGIELPYWPIQLIRDGFVFLFSWVYVSYMRPYIVKYIS